MEFPIFTFLSQNGYALGKKEATPDGAFHGTRKEPTYAH